MLSAPISICESNPLESARRARGVRLRCSLLRGERIGLYTRPTSPRWSKIDEYSCRSGRRICMTRQRAPAFAIARIAVAFPVLFVFGCTLARRQAEEANARAARVGHPEVRYQEELSPGLALTLGFLPFGAAGFYVHSTRLAASGLLWPFSMLWLPNMAYDAAITVNDQAFERRLMDAFERESQPK